MPLRQIEVVIPGDQWGDFKKLSEDDSVIHYWTDTSEESGFLLKVLVDANQTEAFLDKVEELVGGDDGFRLVILEVEATLPRIEEKEEEKPEEEEPDESSDKPWKKPLIGVRVSREELYSQITDAVNFTPVYVAMVVLSTLVASLGVLRDNTAVVIGAMVIAPLLGPNIGLALATTLGDNELFFRSARTNITGLLISFFIAVFLGMMLGVDESVYQIASRTQVHLSDIVLALASGAAGVLAYTIGMSAAVIGVMVAVALLPPLVTAGILVGDMQFQLALYASLLVLTNVICVNLAAVVTFVLQGVSPRTWYASAKAKRHTKRALIIWVSFMILLVFLIWLS